MFNNITSSIFNYFYSNQDAIKESIVSNQKDICPQPIFDENEENLEYLKQKLDYEKKRNLTDYDVNISYIANKIGSSPLLNNLQNFRELDGMNTLVYNHFILKDLNQILKDEKVDLSVEEREEITSLIKTIEFSHSILKLDEIFRSSKDRSIEAKSELINLYNNKIKQLSAGEYILLETNIIENHSIKIKIEKIGKNEFLIKFYNTGACVEKHFSDKEKINHSYPLVFEASEEKILRFLDIIYESKEYVTTQNFYAKLFGFFKNPLNIEEMIKLNISSYHEQEKMGNCVHKSFMVASKSILSKRLYNVVKDQSLKNNIKFIEDNEHLLKHSVDKFYPNEKAYEYYFLLHVVLGLSYSILPTKNYSTIKLSKTHSENSIAELLLWSKITNLIRILKRKENISKSKELMIDLKEQLSKFQKNVAVSFVAQNVSKHGYLLNLVSIDIQKEVLLKSDVPPSVHDMIPNEIREDQEFIKKLILVNPAFGFKIASTELKQKFSNDADLMYSLAFMDVNHLKFASNALLNDPYFMFSIRIRDRSACQYMGEKLECNLSFNNALKDYDLKRDNSRKLQSSSNQVLRPKGNFADIDYVLKMIKIDPRFYVYSSYDLKRDKGLLLEAIKIDPLMIAYSLDKFSKDKEVIETASRQNLFCIVYASDELFSNYEFVSTIVKSHYTF